MNHIFEAEYVDFCRNVLNKSVAAEDYDYYIFISRKCYYYTKLIASRNEENFSIPVDSLRDRDILKGVNLSSLNGKKILLIDDTFHSGATIENVLRCFPGDGERPKIDIAVFCLTPRGLKNLNTNKALKGCRKSYCKLFTGEQMSRMTLCELQGIQQSLYPYVIDLPVFKKIELPYSAFELLTDERKLGWEFHEYKVELGDRVYQNGFFSYSNDFLEEKLGDSLHDMVVKCRYRIEENDNGLVVQCRFVPFVMLRSVSYEKMKELCQSLFSGTAYDGLLESAGSEKSEKYIALYRSAVYVLSYLVGKMFCNYLKFSFDVELDLDKNLSGWSPNEAFQKSIDDIFENVSRENFGMENFKGRLIDLKGSASEPKVQIESPTGKTVFTSDDITYYIMGELSLQKRDFGNNADGEDKRFVAHEKLEKMAAKEFCFSSRYQFTVELTKVLLKLLDSGFISNSLRLTDDKIERGFRLGETSSLLFGYKLKAFYAGIYAYYNVLEMSYEKYQEKYDSFINLFYKFLLLGGYFERKYITEKGFEYFSKYFRLKEDALQREIENKRFVLCSNLQNEEKAIREILSYVYNLKGLRGE